MSVARRERRPGARCFVTCTVCGISRQLAYEYRLSPTSRPESYVCRSCKPRATKPPIDAEYRRDYNLRTRYGITAKQYDAMAKNQGGVCAICRRPPRSQRLHVDHAHDSSRRVRGLLCAPCNTLVEWFLRYQRFVDAYLSDAP